MPVEEALELVIERIVSFFDVEVSPAFQDLEVEDFDPPDVGDRFWMAIREPEANGGHALLLVGCDETRLLLGKPRFRYGLGSSYVLDTPKAVTPKSVEEALDKAQAILSARRRSFRSCVICGRFTPPEEKEPVGATWNPLDEEPRTTSVKGSVCYGCSETKLGLIH